MSNVCISVNTHSMAKDCPGVELNGQSLKIMEKFSNLGETVEVSGGAFDIVITNIRSGPSKFRNLVTLFANKISLLRTEADYIPHVYAALCYMKVRLDQLKRKI